jgi:hypothetical protein
LPTSGVTLGINKFIYYYIFIIYYFHPFWAAIPPFLPLGPQGERRKWVKMGEKEQNSSHFKDSPPKMAWGLFLSGGS